MTNITGLPAPFDFAPSQEWDGNDGSWSTFIVRVGTPAQTFRVLPSTAGHETWVPVPEGCPPDERQDCGDLRGAYPFQGQDSGFLANASSTWDLIGLYDLSLEANLNYTGNGMYGFDSVGAMVDGGLELTDMVVAGIATKDFFLGSFGLGPRPANFSNFEHPQPSFIKTLKDQSKIPSLSYAYTAGASYKMPKVLGSLTLGGYDQSRFTASKIPISFPFSTNDSRSLSVGIQTITATNTINGTVTLSSNDSPILAFIDSTVPHLWLPPSVCERFQEAFGLRYDNETNLYLFDDPENHQKLVKSNPEIVVSLGNDNDPANVTQISLPFAAFNLQASWPIYTNATPYFPIRRAANDTQYTLGRTFLQEAYVIADYERSNFSVHQITFDSKSSEIMTIFPPGFEADSNDSNQRQLSGDVIAGIAVGGVVLVSLLIALFMISLKKRRGKHESDSTSPSEGQYLSAEVPKELFPSQLHEMAHVPTDSNIVHTPAELDSTNLCLLSDDARRHELASERATSPEHVSL